MSHLFGPREMVVLTVLAEMYAAPMDRVAAMLRVSTKSAYRYASKWRAAQMISKYRMRPVPGPAWVVPSRIAVESLLPFYARFWTPSPKMAAHVTTVLDVRLALVGLDLERWISERQLRAEQPRPKQGTPRGHVHDGRYYRADGSLWAVEVELTPKSDTAAVRAVAAAKAAAAEGGCATVIYYCKTEWTDANGTLIRRSEEIREVIKRAAQRCAHTEGPPIRVADLSEVLPDSAEPAQAGPKRSGLTVIRGGADSGIADTAVGEVVS